MLKEETQEKKVKSDNEAVPKLQIMGFRFEDPEIEKEFQAYFKESMQSILRAALIGGIVVYIFLGLIDHLSTSDPSFTISKLRYFYALPFMLLCMLLSFQVRLPIRVSVLSAATIFIAGFSFVIMSVIGDPPSNSTYYVALILFLMYLAFFVPISFFTHCFIVISLYLAYILSLLFLTDIMNTLTKIILIFISVACLLIIAAGYIRELFFRQQFISLWLLHKRNQNVERLRKQALEANHSKSEFLAVMSHELRTPLNAIIGFSEIIYHEMHGEILERYKNYSADIHCSAQHLLSIINDILDLSKAESGQLAMSEEWVPIEEITDACMRIMRDQTKAKGIKLSVNGADENIEIRVDERLIRQSILNLISNALKFTQEEGKIMLDIGYPTEDGSLIFSVIDSGIGIEERNQKRVFEPFVQVEDSMRRNRDGTGLGLSLVRRIVEMHNGQVALTSKLGIGTEISITFPPERCRNIEENFSEQSGKNKQTQAKGFFPLTSGAA